MDGDTTITHVEGDEEWRLLLDTAGDRLVVVDFFAVWCGPCHAIAPVFERLSREYASVAIFLKVDVDRNPGVSAACGVSAMPTFHFYKQGRLLQELRGSNAPELERLVALHAGALNPSPGPDALKKRYQSFPPDTYPCFEGESNVDQVWTKLTQFNDQLAGTANHLDAETLATIKMLFTLTQDVRYRHSAIIPSADLALLNKIISEWPVASLFPLLDLNRRLILIPSAAEYHARSYAESNINSISTSLRRLASDASVGNVLMSIRCLVNCFSNLALRKIIVGSSEAIRLVKEHKNHSNKQVRLAVAVYLLNYVKASACDKVGSAEEAERTLDALLSCLALEQDDEVKLRYILAVGSLVAAQPSLCQVAKSHSFLSAMFSSSPQLLLPLEELRQLLAN